MKDYRTELWSTTLGRWERVTLVWPAETFALYARVICAWPEYRLIFSSVLSVTVFKVRVCMVPSSICISNVEAIWVPNCYMADDCGSNSGVSTGWVIPETDTYISKIWSKNKATWEDPLDLYNAHHQVSGRCCNLGSLWAASRVWYGPRFKHITVRWARALTRIVFRRSYSTKNFTSLNAKFLNSYKSSATRCRYW